MAFGRAETDEAYKKLIAPTFRRMKITPIRVDRIEHLEDINNKIIAELGKCDLALADLTFARPSVYFEAGYAQRAVPVIYTCRSDHLSGSHDDRYGNFRVHFDLRMKNIIPWSSTGDAKFSKKLERRVMHAVLPILRAKKNMQELRKDDYVQFGDKSGYMKNDALIILKELNFKHTRDIVVSYEMYSSQRSKTVLAATNRIRIRELSFSRRFRFLVNFLNEWYPAGGYDSKVNIMRAMHGSNEYANLKYNNIWVEISYGRFRETSLRSRYSSFPRGFTIIPVNANLSYIGHDRTTFQFHTINERTISRLKHFRSVIKARNLCNYSILENVLATTGKARARSHEETVIQKELEILNKELATNLDKGYSYSLRVAGSRPGFVIHNVRSKAAIRSNLSLMLDWIANNGHWL